MAQDLREMELNDILERHGGQLVSTQIHTLSVKGLDKPKQLLSFVIEFKLILCCCLFLSHIFQFGHVTFTDLKQVLTAKKSLEGIYHETDTITEIYLIVQVN